MAREKLREREGVRSRYRGTFERYGVKPAFRNGSQTTVLLVSIQDAEGNAICDHLWFADARPFMRLCLRHGDVLEFYGRVIAYRKSLLRKNGERDWRIELPTGIRVVRRLHNG